MLPDFKAGLFFTALRLRHVHLVALEVSIGGTGAPTLVSVNSVGTGGDIAWTSPGLPNVPAQTSPIVRTGTGLYTVQLPPGKAAVLLTAEFVRNSGAYALGEVTAAAVNSKNEVTGAFNIVTLAGSGAPTDPVNGSTMTLFFLVSKI